MSTHSLEILALFLLTIVTFFAGLAKRLNIPYPILLVLAGLAISFVPHVPRIPLSPDLVFLVFLPPLLYAAAWQTNLRDFRRNLFSITLLATGLVGFTVLGIAFFADRFITALDFKSGFLLGAVVAATDAVAATSIARSLGISPRIVGILEGESLLNDATALLALEFGLSMLLSGTSPSVGEGSLRLLWLIFGGTGLGLLLGRIMTVVEHWISEGPLEMAVSLIVPYVAYLAAEELHTSGVIAVVACGLFLSRRSAGYLAPTARLEIMSAWKALDFILNGVVFVLIGLQLPYILAGIRDYSVWTLLFYGLSFSAMLIALRLIWAFPGAYFARWFRKRILHHKVQPLTAKGVFVIGWTGMRGVVSLAAAFSLPINLADGRPFAQRNLILFLTFCIILVTLVLQGLTLPMVIRRLGLADNREAEEEELKARCTVLAKAISELEKQRATATEDEAHDIDDLLHRYQHRLEAITVSDRVSRSPGLADEEETKQTTERHQRRYQILRETVSIERRTIAQMRDAGDIGDEVLRRLERELDLTETRYDSFT